MIFLYCESLQNDSANKISGPVIFLYSEWLSIREPVIFKTHLLREINLYFAVQAEKFLILFFSREIPWISEFIQTLCGSVLEMVFRIPQDIWSEIVMNHLGLGEFQALTQLSKHFWNLLIPLRPKILLSVKLHLFHRLDKWGDLSASDLSLLSTHEAMIAGSALLAIVNKEVWIPNDIDIWVREKYREEVCDSELSLMLTNGTPLRAFYASWNTHYPRVPGNFRLISRKFRRNHGHTPLNLLMISPTETNSRLFGDQIVNFFDADFLKISFDGQKLCVHNVQSIADRFSQAYVTNDDSDLKHRQERRKLRFELYANRQFWIGPHFLTLTQNETWKWTGLYLRRIRSQSVPVDVMKLKTQALTNHERFEEKVEGVLLETGRSVLLEQNGLLIFRSTSNLFQSLLTNKFASNEDKIFDFQFFDLITQHWRDFFLSMMRLEVLIEIVLRYIPFAFEILAKNYESYEMRNSLWKGFHLE